MDKKISKEEIKEKILEVIDMENRNLSIRELTLILRRKEKDKQISGMNRRGNTLMKEKRS